MNWIQLHNGKVHEICEPNHTSIDANTISLVLSRICRFGGHCSRFYTVAQHSLLVESLVNVDELRLPALLHDAHEAYWGFGDICRPAKTLNTDTRVFLKQLAWLTDVTIAHHFGFNPNLFHRREIKDADNRALATEVRDLMPPCDRDWNLPLPHDDPLEVITSDEAAEFFRARLNFLSEYHAAKFANL